MPQTKSAKKKHFYFQSDCPDPANPNAFNFECECEGQYWQNQDCTEGFLCYQVNEGNSHT